jgi:hypothetical protein
MTPQSRRSAALLISLHIDSDGSDRWHARISSYQNAFASPTALVTQTTVEGVCDTLRDWLASVVNQELAAGGGGAQAT